VRERDKWQVARNGKEYQKVIALVWRVVREVNSGRNPSASTCLRALMQLGPSASAPPLAARVVSHCNGGRCVAARPALRTIKSHEKAHLLELLLHAQLHEHTYKRRHRQRESAGQLGVVGGLHERVLRAVGSRLAAMLGESAVEGEKKREKR
jgi:hypothetical protein